MSTLRKYLSESAATALGAAKLVLLFGFPFLILGPISLSRIYMYGPFAHFSLDNVYIPKFLPSAATNLVVFSFCLAGFALVVISVAWRYFYHRKTIAFMRKRGVRDFDGDGRTDSFADDFLDDP